jgi:carboxylate-amine ligase
MGMEQEFFLVDGEGVISNKADAFLERCWALAEDQGLDPKHFAPECVKNLVEVSTPPMESLEDLAKAYLESVETALRAARELDLRLYPLATYPLPITPELREETHYRIQSETLGAKKFLHAGRCAGVHLHLEVSSGTIDSRVGVDYDSSPESRQELLNVYNLATALDPAIIALTRACPFYEGQLTALAGRTAYYRGSPQLSPEGLYGELEAAGGLRPYAEDAATLVELQFERYYAWLSAMDRAGVERGLFFEAGDGMLDAAWNPVRLNDHGTIELRGIDSNFPEVILEIARLVSTAKKRILEEGLTVSPAGGLTTFAVEGQHLIVPGFEELSVDLFREAATLGVYSPKIAAYLDSIFYFTGAEDFESIKQDSVYHCTETEILETYGAELSRDTGLQLVREACDRLEHQVNSLQARETPAIAATGRR